MSRGNVMTSRAGCNGCGCMSQFERNGNVWGAGDSIMVLLSCGLWLALKVLFNCVRQPWRCANCGASMSALSAPVAVLTGGGSLLAAILLFGTLGRTCLGSDSRSGANTFRPTPTSSATAQTPEQRARAAKEQLDQEGRRLGLKWRYDESDDQMGRGRVRRAAVNSLNEVNFDFPYGGDQRGTLTVRVHPKFGKDVILAIDKGQFLCGFDGCSVAVRFDEGKAQTFSAVGPGDHSTAALFFRGYERFVASTKKAKRVYIEAQFYQQGSRVFEFDVSDFNW